MFKNKRFQQTVDLFNEGFITKSWNACYNEINKK